MHRVRRRSLARDDVLGVWEYLAEVGSIEAADRWVTQLDLKLRLLASHPLVGRARDELAPGLRSIPFGRHVVFYLPMEDGADIVRVLHGARDLDSAFADE